MVSGRNWGWGWGAEDVSLQRDYQATGQETEALEGGTHRAVSTWHAGNDISLGRHSYDRAGPLLSCDLSLHFVCCCWDKTPDKNTLRKEGFIVALSLRPNPPCWRRRDGGDVRLVTWYLGRKQRAVKTGAQLGFSFDSVWDPGSVSCPHPVRRPFLLTPPGDTLTDVRLSIKSTARVTTCCLFRFWLS